MRRAPFAAVAALALAGGCLSSTVKEGDVRYWTVEPPPAPAASRCFVASSEPFRVTRLGRVQVMAPWDGENLAIRRGDGSIAIDRRNLFAARPSSLIKTAAFAAAAAAFPRVVLDGSAAACDDELELVVTELSLDCSGAVREASVSLSATLVRAPGRRPGPSASGSARVDASGGDYSAAFGAAFAKALEQALAGLTR